MLGWQGLGSAPQRDPTDPGIRIAHPDPKGLYYAVCDCGRWTHEAATSYECLERWSNHFCKVTAREPVVADPSDWFATVRASVQRMTPGTPGHIG